MWVCGKKKGDDLGWNLAGGGSNCSGTFLIVEGGLAPPTPQLGLNGIGGFHFMKDMCLFVPCIKKASEGIGFRLVEAGHSYLWHSWLLCCTMAISLEPRWKKAVARSLSKSLAIHVQSADKSAARTDGAKSVVAWLILLAAPPEVGMQGQSCCW